MTPTDANAPVAESSPAISVPTDPQEYSEWRVHGKLPEAKPAKPAAEKPKSEESAPSEETSAEGEEPQEKHAPESEPGKPKQEAKPRSNAETRLNELLADLRNAGLSPSELKTFRKQAEAAKPAVEQPKSEHTEKPVADEKRPKEEDFATYAEYIDAVADWKAQKAVEAYAAKQRQEAASKSITEKLNAAEKKYGAEAKGVIATAAKGVMQDQAIPKMVKDVFDGSTVAFDLLYVMGSKPDEFARFIELARTNPNAAIREAIYTERLVLDELGKGSAKSGTPERGEDGKFKPTTPAKKVTEAPPPPKEASGRSSAPPDEVEDALKSGDFKRYRDAENRKEIARRKGQR